MGQTIEIVEVGPRDGLQSEPEILPTATKLQLIQRLVDAGLRRIEVASFVNPKRVPQMADAEAVLSALPEVSGVQYVGLVLNRKGFDRAQFAAGKKLRRSRAKQAFALKSQSPCRLDARSKVKCQPRV
jgi:hydroxymethylglutaryl-CoA lyase